jgi:hypothetical protein
MIEAEEQAAGGTFDPGLALRAAEESLLQLETTAARAYVDALRKAESVEPGMLRRALEVEAESYWIDGDEDAARLVWRRLFSEHADAVVDFQLPPDSMAAMAEQQGVARAVSSRVQTARETPAPPHPATVILFGAGGGAAAFGFAFSGGAHEEGLKLYSGGETSHADWQEDHTSYDRFRDQEPVGAGFAALGSAALVGGIVHLIVEQAHKEKRTTREGVR